MTHTIRRAMFAAVLALIALAAAGTTATAQTCIIINGVKVYVTPDTYVGNTTNGFGTFTATKPIPAAGALNERLTPQVLNVSTNEPTLGTVTTFLDLSRLASPTTIVSNIPGVRFPATGTINFFANATVSSRPGNFRSRTELSFQSTGLNSVAPFNAETFTLVNDVEFEDANGDLEFTLKGGTTTVTLN